MPDEENLTPEMPTMPWLARNRKIVILGGVVLLLGVAVFFTTRLRTASPTASTDNTTNIATTTTNTVANYARPTFQRSTVANVDTSLPESYAPPTQNDLQQAITNLNQ